MENSSLCHTDHWPRVHWWTYHEHDKATAGGNSPQSDLEISILAPWWWICIGTIKKKLAGRNCFVVCLNSMGKQRWATNDKKQPLVVSDKHLTAFGNAGSLTPVIGFFSRYGAFAANSGLGRSSSSWIIIKRFENWKSGTWNMCLFVNWTWNPIQSQWCASEAFFLFQYSRKVTAVEEIFCNFHFILGISIVDINVLMKYKIREKEKFIQRF